MLFGGEHQGGAVLSLINALLLVALEVVVGRELAVLFVLKDYLVNPLVGDLGSMPADNAALLRLVQKLHGFERV